MRQHPSLQEGRKVRMPRLYVVMPSVYWENIARETAVQKPGDGCDKPNIHVGHGGTEYG